MKRRWLICLLMFSLLAKSQTITTVAGGGAGGDNGPATAASIYNPGYIVMDKSGNLYFTEGLGHKIRKVDIHGVITTIAGTGTSGFSGDGGPATAAKLNQPCGIAIDASGNILFADNANNRIRKITVTTGIISTIIGNSTGGFGGDGGLASAATLYMPGGIYFDKFWNLYIADDANFRLRKVNTSGIITTIAGNGLSGWSGDGGSATNAKCAPYAGICTDAAGNIFMAEYTNGTIRKINTSGIISTIAGSISSYTYNGDEIPASNARLVPLFVIVDGNGILYVSDYNNNRVRMIDSKSIIHTIAGNGTAGFGGDGGKATDAQINWPAGIIFDSCNNLYVSQIVNPRIRKVALNPLCWKLGVGNEQPSTQNIYIYPNPANNELHIDNLQNKSTYALLNTVGQSIQTGILKAGRNSIYIQSLASGIYLLQLTDHAGMRSVSKVVKQ